MLRLESDIGDAPFLGLFEDDPHAVAVGILDLEERPDEAGADGARELGEVLAREARDPREGEPAERRRDAKVDDAAAAFHDLDPGKSRARAAGCRRRGGQLGLRGGRRRGWTRGQGIEDRPGLLGCQASLGDELQHGLEGIAHRAAPSTAARRSVAVSTSISPRSRARRISRRAFSTSGLASGAASAGAAAKAVGAAGSAGAAGVAGTGGIGGAASRGSSTRRSPETDLNMTVAPSRPTLIDRRPGLEDDLCGSSLISSPVTLWASTCTGPRDTRRTSPLIVLTSNGPFPARSASTRMSPEVVLNSSRVRRGARMMASPEIVRPTSSMAPFASTRTSPDTPWTSRLPATSWRIRSPDAVRYRPGPAMPTTDTSALAVSIATRAPRGSSTSSSALPPPLPISKLPIANVTPTRLRTTSS